MPVEIKNRATSSLRSLAINLLPKYRTQDTILSTSIMAERNADSDISKKFVVLPDNIRREVMEWFNGSKEVRIFITGKTGVGKSALVNGLIGKKVAKEGDTLNPETLKVKGYEKQCHCVKVTVWDSPGLDGTSNEAKYLQDMKTRCSRMDICIYCVSMMETRFREGCADIIAMKKLTAVLGKKMWENALFVLTFANLAEDVDSEILEAEDAQKPELFQARIKLWKETLVGALIKDVGVEAEVANRIEVVPAGYHTLPALLDRDHWLSPFWFAALYAMHPRAQPAMVRLNVHRIVDKPEEVSKEDLQKFIHEQPLIFSKRGALVGAKYGESEVGKAIGCSIGEDASAQIKMLCETMASPLGLLSFMLIKNIVAET